ncbi:MAG: hypothetical protein NC041_03605 [Bacteroides sp.]|nr:hypothetical protein [Prevotella sp.]MCM1408210.1 hypothetical protein [Treponema brennaborense]MCM1469534.1 hypothetical protein [Bacteroides sp.]
MKNAENIFANQNETDGFIKTTDTPLKNLTAEQKVILNRRGNMLLNQRNILQAKRLFLTTGYSDGLTRIGDILEEEGSDLSALKLYWLAHNKKKCGPIIEKIAKIISALIK